MALKQATLGNRGCFQLCLYRRYRNIVPLVIFLYCPLKIKQKKISKHLVKRRIRRNFSSQGKTTEIPCPLITLKFWKYLRVINGHHVHQISFLFKYPSSQLSFPHNKKSRSFEDSFCPETGVQWLCVALRSIDFALSHMSALGELHCCPPILCL